MDEYDDEPLVDQLKGQYQANLIQFSILEEKFEAKFGAGEWVNDLTFAAQCFIDIGQEMIDHMMQQEILLNMYQKKFGPIQGDQLKIAINAKTIKPGQQDLVKPS